MIRGTFVIKIYVLKDMRQSTNLFRVSFNIVFMPHKSFCTLLLQVTTFYVSKSLGWKIHCWFNHTFWQKYIHDKIILRTASCKKSISFTNSIRKNKSTRKHIFDLKMCFLVDLFFLIELFFLIDFLHEAALNVRMQMKNLVVYF